ncbi:MAG: hypothetical protein ACRD3B_11185 [Candidatus Sulfotelmatobacter sp.]
MRRRDQWRPVLDAELKRWSAKSCEQLLAELGELRAYETEFKSKKYQVEVEILENTEKYVHVVVAVDDSALPASISPLSEGFIREK